MILREYKESDIKEIAELFYNTVHSVNAADYSRKQLDSWADGNIDYEEWNQSFLKHYTVVAVINNEIAGFGDIDSTGYLDHLYVHKDYQKEGIASKICDRLENRFEISRIETHSSITARPFFEKRGYKVIKKQTVIRKGVELPNYIMIKENSKKD